MLNIKKLILDSLMHSALAESISRPIKQSGVIKVTDACTLLEPISTNHMINVTFSQGWVNVNDRVQFKIHGFSETDMREIATRFIMSIKMRKNLITMMYSKHLGRYAPIKTSKVFEDVILAHFMHCAGKCDLSLPDSKVDRSNKVPHVEMHITISEIGFLIESFNNTPHCDCSSVPNYCQFTFKEVAEVAA